VFRRTRRSCLGIQRGFQYTVTFVPAKSVQWIIWCIWWEMRWQEVRILSVPDFEEYNKTVAILIIKSVFTNATLPIIYFAISVILFSVRAIVLFILNKGSRQDKWRRVDSYDMVALTKGVKKHEANDKTCDNIAIAKMTITYIQRINKLSARKILCQTFLSHFCLFQLKNCGIWETHALCQHSVICINKWASTWAIFMSYNGLMIMH
jgi:hypothetical protein